MSKKKKNVNKVFIREGMLFYIMIESLGVYKFGLGEDREVYRFLVFILGEVFCEWFKIVGLE